MVEGRNFSASVKSVCCHKWKKDRRRVFRLSMTPPAFASFRFPPTFPRIVRVSPSTAILFGRRVNISSGPKGECRVDNVSITLGFGAELVDEKSAQGVVLKLSCETDEMCFKNRAVGLRKPLGEFISRHCGAMS